MITWKWTRHRVEPEHVLDAARSIDVNSSRITLDPTSDWRNARDYLAWAKAAFERGNSEGWDSAVSLAKRAVCGRMDATLVHNHMHHLLTKNYGQKSKYLRELNVPGLRLLNEDVIRPRNDLEHAYTTISREQASRAYEIAELFIKATQEEADVPMIAALGWNVSHRNMACSVPGREYETFEFRLDPQQEPMLLIDAYASPPEVFILKPHEQSLAVCECSKFSFAMMLEMNVRLKECLAFDSFSSYPIDQDLMKIIRHELRV